MTNHLRTLALSLTVLAAAPAAAANCAGRTAPLSEAARAFRAGYVLAGPGDRTADRFQQAIKAGDYRRICDPKALERRVTDDLRRWSGDGHVRLELPAAPGDADDGEGAWIARWRAEAPKRQYGLPDPAVGADGIGVLRVTSFYPPDLAEAPALAAMRLLAPAHGLILDVRGNGGGDSDMVRLLLSWLLERPGQVYRRAVDRNGTEREAATVRDDLGVPRFAGPVAVLIDGKSFSAAEELPYVLQAQGRARVFGARTGGGAHQIEDVKLAGGWRIWVPLMRQVVTGTGTDWEGTGVVPDQATDQPEAAARAWLRTAVEASKP